jgi:acetyl-CoA C-acetyltransferase
MNGRKVYVVDGARTPFLKARGEPGLFSASDLAVACARPVLARQPFPATLLTKSSWAASFRPRTRPTLRA